MCSAARGARRTGAPALASALHAAERENFADALLYVREPRSSAASTWLGARPVRISVTRHAQRNRRPAASR